MRVIKTETPTQLKLNTFDITFRFEHGDTEFISDQVVSLIGASDETLMQYVCKCQEIAMIINSQRNEESELPSLAPGFAECCGFSIPTEHDVCFAGSGIYSDMRIVSIVYYDHVGKKFNVSVQE